MRYTIYDTTTGDIIKVSNVAKGDVPILLDGQGFIEGDCDDATCKVDVGAKTIGDKDTMGTSINKVEGDADGADTITISDIPSGVVARVVNGMLTVSTETVTGGTVELTADAEVMYNVRLRGAGYVDERYEVIFRD